ncbi:MAG: AAA family ATPase [Candidatus Dadabacteria bacterium]|nr:AAA family ATPase [Candidatus Dadabacteria bacterium]NIS09799.1 AAA family ATPase [Candidatus Dadabacteria bacterium]NIV41155.1 AAA family ATPase [Candidatus Dadabacteria bacterium]NIX16240.1 AAA family ATPase [Candidatus Dadabacteria bacterium]NIY22860.1 AAA family ATPase [Candidatus Dadabacteria bacterium]
MQSTNMLREIELLIKSNHSIIFIETAEEERADALIKHVADRMNLGFFIWSASKGLRRVDDEEAKGSIYQTVELALALGHVESSGFPAIYHFQGITQYFEDMVAVTRLKDTAKTFSDKTGAIIITGLDIEIPHQLKPYCAVVKIPEPDEKEYQDLLHHVIRDLQSKMDVQFKLDAEELNKLLNNLKGLTLMEAEKVLTKAIVEDGILAPKDIRRVIEEKIKVVEREGLLEYYPNEETMDSIADLRGLKSWLAKRKEIILQPDKAREFGLTFPKGVLLLGVPGCGKSLCAKAVAMEWGLPLLKLDPSNLYNKYIGESEKNFKRAMETAEKLSPVILWIDEIEKAFSSVSGDHDAGVSTRIFGTFLSWLQDRNGDVFIVATANDVQKLPAEFLRKGRFDEIFFVDVPDPESREAIFKIHLEKRGKDSDKFDMNSIVEATTGFSGSEIEQVIVSALYTSFSNDLEVSTSLLLDEIRVTKPLTVTMGDRINYLREWAKERTVSAHD